MKRPDTPLKLTYKKVSSNVGKQTSSDFISAFGSTATINVRRCDVLADADVWLRLNYINGDYLTTLPTKHQNTGVYTATIPSGLAPSVNPNQICNQLAGLIGPACFITIPALCIGVEAALILSGVGSTVVVPVIAACSEAAASAALFCAAFEIGGEFGGASLGEAFCNAAVVNRTFTQDLLLVPYAIGLPNDIFGPSVRFTQGDNPNLGISLGGSTKILTLDLVPNVPTVNQSYQANIRVSCITQGSEVRISVLGTDGYTNSVSYSVPSTESLGEFSLVVPGAASQGITDVVSISITLPNGDILTRTASLIFR